MQASEFSCKQKWNIWFLNVDAIFKFETNCEYCCKIRTVSLRRSLRRNRSGGNSALLTIGKDIMQKNQYELEYEYGITYVCVVQKDHFSGSKTI